MPGLALSQNRVGALMIATSRLSWASRNCVMSPAIGAMPLGPTSAAPSPMMPVKMITYTNPTARSTSQRGHR